jgi:cytochrome P450
MTDAYILSVPQLDDPYPYYKSLRDEDPVHYSPVEDLWVITRFEDCLSIFGNWQLWSSRQRGNLINDPPERIGLTLGTTDPPSHDVARKLVNKAFTPSRVTNLEPLIRELAHRLSADAADRGNLEFVQDFAAPLNAAVLGALFGLGEQDVLTLRPALDDFFTREPSQPGAVPPHVKAMATLRQFLEELALDRKRLPSSDLVSAMIAAEDEGARLELDQVVVTTMTFLTAGFESVNNLFTNMAGALAKVPGLFAVLKSDPGRIPAFVEEAMRWDAAAQGFVRSPTADVEMAGVTVPAGAQVLVHIGAANRDDRQFGDADRFDLDRPTSRHLGLGHGAHFCVGAPLGRLLARVSFQELLGAARKFEPDFPTAVRVKTPNFRGFLRLEVDIA